MTVQTFRASTFLVLAAAALTLAGCATIGDRDDAMSRLRSAKKVLVVSLIGDRIEWLHLGLTVFNNAEATLAHRSPQLDQAIAEAISARLRARGIRAVATVLASEGPHPSFPTDPLRRGDARDDAQPFMARLRDLGSREGAQIIVFVARPHSPGASAGPNGIRVQSRSLMGLLPTARVHLAMRVVAFDPGTGKEVFSKPTWDTSVGVLPPQFNSSALPDELRRHELEIDRMVKAYFDKDGATWLDQ